MKVYLAQYYSYDGETHTTILGIYESSELAWEAIRNEIAERHREEEFWYMIEDFDVIEYELNKRIGL